MKPFITLVLAVTLKSVVSQNLSDGLQACYPMDISAQNKALSGAVLNGGLTNVTSTVGHTGLPNTALQLNGSDGSYIELPEHPALKNDTVFFSGWFHIDSMPSQQYLLYTYNGCVANFEAYSIHTYYEPSVSQQVFCLTKCSDCVNKPQIISLVAPAPGNWYHICFYIDNAGMKLYVNGALQATDIHSVPIGYQSGFNVYLGVTHQSSFEHPFKGAVDDVRFYNRELTAQEINLLYTEDLGCQAPVSSFWATRIYTCINEDIIITDQSFNNPTSWNWQMPDATPATSTLNSSTITYTAPGIYTVTLIASSPLGPGGVFSKTISVHTCVSIEEDHAAALSAKIYPNPATGQFYIENLADHAFEVNDILGRPVKFSRTRVHDNLNEIKLFNKIPGIYLVMIYDARGECRQRIKVLVTE